jgi:hypothetical protein
MKQLILTATVLLQLAFFAACEKSAVNVSTSSPAASTAAISASPNPVPTSQGVGTTTITWNTGDGTDAQVYVYSPDGGPESLVAAGPTGSVAVPWILAGKTVEFRLYAGSEHVKVLAKTQITGQK